jgi:hypothetical protein
MTALEQNPELKIVTYISVNPGDLALYPQLEGFNVEGQRLNYWQCAAVFFASCRRCNPDARLVLYTNDEDQVTIRNRDVKKFLQEIDVEIIPLPFETFRPPIKYSTLFTNAFYKFDVMQVLGREPDTPTILLDADSVWARPNDEIKAELADGTLLLYDVHEEINPDKRVDGLSRRERGIIYKQIYPDYPTSKPVHIGGEVVAGSGRHFQILAEKLLISYQIIIKKFKDDPPQFADGRKIFDGNENLGSMVFNMVDLPWKNADSYIKRIWTGHSFKNIEGGEVELPIWHVPAEKRAGILQLYKQALDRTSQFWQTPIQMFNSYLGGYLGIPKRRITLGSLSTSGKSLFSKTARLFSKQLTE